MQRHLKINKENQNPSVRSWNLENVQIKTVGAGEL